MRPDSTARQPLLWTVVAALGLVAAFVLAPAPGAVAAPFSPGVVEVDGYGFEDVVDVREDALAGATGRTVGIKVVMQEGEKSGEFELSTVQKVEIALPGSQAKFRTYSGNQIRNNPGSVPRFRFEDERTVMILPNGAEVAYAAAGSGLNPRIYIPANTSTIDVKLTPEARKIKSGESVTFKADVTGGTGQLTYRWSFGDGSKDLVTTKGSVSHTFKGNDRTFGVTLTVSDSSSTRKGTASAVIIIGDTKKPEKKQKENGNRNSDRPDDRDYGDDDYGDDPGHGDGYGDGYGDDYGNGSPGTGTPAAPRQPKKDEPEPPVDDGPETVRGELLDPSIPAEVIDPSSQDPATGADPAEPEEEEGGGFGLSGGAKTAIGIAFLLGLGGLTELRTFSRFR